MKSWQSSGDNKAMFTCQRLTKTLKALGIESTPAIFQALEKTYSHPARVYHGKTHIAACLESLDRHTAIIASNPEEIEIAIWFHDAIYDTTRSDNELNSAQWAIQYLSKEQAPPESIERIQTMILATQTHQANGNDTALMLDINLEILGSSPSQFETYDQAIQQEYSWVPRSQYLTERMKVLQSFLDRPRIYKTESFFNRLEAQARTNLAAKIHELESCIQSI